MEKRALARFWYKIKCFKLSFGFLSFEYGLVEPPNDFTVLQLKRVRWVLHRVVVALKSVCDCFCFTFTESHNVNGTGLVDEWSC